MNILIVTPYYKHDKNIASVRWTNISGRLSANHTVTVVSQPLEGEDDSLKVITDDGIRVARLGQATGYEKIAVKYFHGASGEDWQTKTYTKTNVATPSQSSESFARKMKNKVLYGSMKSTAKKYASKICREVLDGKEKVDVVISSACPFIEMLFGYEISRKLKCKWICDFRDLPFHDDSCDGTHRAKAIMQKVLNVADAVITIAPKGKEFLADGIVKNKDKIHVITNGFSMADAHEGKTVSDDVLHLVHTGSLYSGNRKADLLFKAIEKVKKVHPDYKFVLECAGGNNETLVMTAEKYGMADIVDNHGFIPRNDALAMQCSSDCLLALVENRTGSLAAKLFEYILCEKPVICVTCGSEPDSEETRFVRSLNLGIAVEEANGEEDVDKLADYLAMQYEKKVNGEPLEYSPDREAIKQYDHDNIVKRIEALCFSTINE